MTSIENCNKAMLKLAQFRSLIVNNKKPTDKDLTFILQGLELNLKVSDTIFLKEYYSELIGRTLLDLAYRNLNIDVLNNLINRGVDFNAKNKNGNTILHEIFHSCCGFLGFTAWDIKKEQSYLIHERIPFIESVLSAHIKYNDSSNPSDSNGLTHFHIACATNNIEAVKFFLSNGVPVNKAVTKAILSEHFEGYTVLHFAAQFGNLDMIETLLAHGADTNFKDIKGKTPLHIALERNIAMIDSAKESYCHKRNMDNQKIMSLLLIHTDRTELSTLYVESAIEDSYLTREVLLQTENINQCISMDSQVWPGYTALHFAAHFNVNKVKVLVDHGANIEAKDAKGVTPFEICIDRYKAEDLFIILGLVPEWKDIVLSDGKTKLIDLVLALKDIQGIRKLLKESGQNIKLFVPVDSPLWPGLTVLHLAVLLSERTKCKADYKENEKHLVFSPNLTVITEILKQGADVTVKDQRNWTPIHLAFRLEKTETLNLLLQYHCKTTNVVDEDNLSHLHVACTAGNEDMVEKLSCNNDVDIVYNGDSRVSCVYPGWTPLHVALHKRYIEITKMLLKFGANVHAIYRVGFTPIHDSLPKEFSKILFGEKDLRDFVVRDLELSYLHVACLSLNDDAVERLLDIGVDINRVVTWKTEVGDNSPNVLVAKTHDGSTSLHLAVDNLSAASPARLRIASLLIKRGADLFIKNLKNVSPWAAILEGGMDEFLNAFWTALNGNDGLRKNVEEETGLTMLHVACRRMDWKSTNGLLKSGADVNARISDDSSIWPGFTPLHVLILSYDDFKGETFKKMLILLLKSEADVTLPNADKRTPLHMAYHRLYAESDETSLNHVSLMLKAHRNFEVNPTSAEGISHFHIACHILDVEAVEDFFDFGQVDVNSRIDVFCNFVNAASSPLLLATGKKCWGEVQTLIESSRKLRIVGLLIKHGARVDVEDLEGNTAAHNATLSCFMRDNYLQRLANGGADLNAINIRGETPLELLLKEKDPRKIVEGLRQFVASGSLFNAFNSLTEEGFVALANSRLTHENMRSLLTWTFVNCPDSMKSDDMNRNALHNLVSVRSSASSEIQYAELFDVLMKFGCDIDDQDESGRTALHLAAQFRNESAVEGLFLSGANVNITDYSGKTPFAYVFEPCSRCTNPSENHTQYSHHDLFKIFLPGVNVNIIDYGGKTSGVNVNILTDYSVETPFNCVFQPYSGYTSPSENHTQYSHHDLFKIFASQIQRMQLCNLEVNKSNESLLRETLKQFNPNFVGNHAEFSREIAEIRKLKIKPYSLCAGDFISDTAAVIDYSSMSQAKRKTISAFFRKFKSCFGQEFKRAAGISLLQYRQAVLRQQIINDAKDALSCLAKFRFPDTCSHIITKSLRNSELQNLILSTSLNEIANIDVDC